MSETASTPTSRNSDRAEMNDVIAHLNAVLDEDEQAARECGGAPWSAPIPGMIHVDAKAKAENKHAWGKLGYVATVGHEEDQRHIARHDPARVLREVEALRRVIDDYRMADRACMRSDDPMSPEYATIRAGRDALKGVLIAYADATGWKPTD